MDAPHPHECGGSQQRDHQAEAGYQHAENARLCDGPVHRCFD
jgi:hypothetical protein